MFCWTLSYVIVNGDLNLELLVEYFILAWTFDGLERPLFTWILSLILFVLIIVLYWVVIGKKRKHTEKFE